jgi:hypothetical protein
LVHVDSLKRLKEVISKLGCHKPIRLERIRVFGVSIFFAAALLFGVHYCSIAQEKTINDELNQEFALGNGPRFELPDEQQKVVDRVIKSVTGGYYGDLVIPSELNSPIHSSAFLSRYLREFSSIEKNRGIREYDIRFESILSLVSRYPAMLDDPMLDWDIYRSLRLYEISWPGKDWYEEEPLHAGDAPSFHDLESANDLAWMYIDHHANDLIKDGDRLQWWVDHLACRLNEPDRSRVHRWFLLKLCTLAERLPSEESYEKPIGNPSPEDPFLVVEENSKPLSFQEALHRIVRTLGISFEVWGIDPQKMPPARMLNRNTTASDRWPQDRSFIIGQESWSDPEKVYISRWGVRFFSIKYRRVQYNNVSIPSDRKDGVFFFPFNNRLYVWPKAGMDAGVLKMLHLAGLIDDAKLDRLLEACGFRKLETTLTGR